MIITEKAILLSDELKDLSISDILKKYNLDPDKTVINVITNKFGSRFKNCCTFEQKK